MTRPNLLWDLGMIAARVPCTRYFLLWNFYPATSSLLIMTCIQVTTNNDPSTPLLGFGNDYLSSPTPTFMTRLHHIRKSWPAYTFSDNIDSFVLMSLNKDKTHLKMNLKHVRKLFSSQKSYFHSIFQTYHKITRLPLYVLGYAHRRTYLVFIL